MIRSVSCFSAARSVGEGVGAGGGGEMDGGVVGAVGGGPVSGFGG